MKNPKFEIYTGSNDEFYFRLFAVNGENILGSEGYIKKSDCKNGIHSVKTNGLVEERFDKKVAADGRNYFNLTAANGQVIGTSQMYSSESSRDDGIDSVINTVGTWEGNSEMDAGIEDNS
jgi:hypothetical protein